MSEPQPAVYIWVRATVDWADREAFLAQADAALHDKAEVWDATFTIPFHLFRHEVREIARSNLARVESAVCAPWDQIPDGSLVLPTDDDDWFAPDAARALLSHRDAVACVYHWPSTFIEVPIDLGHRLDVLLRRYVPRMPPKRVCATNNYAVVKTAGAESLARSHLRASEWVASQSANGRVRALGARLSVMNRTLASQTSLAWQRAHVSRPQLIRKFERYRRLYRTAEVSHVPWCRPYVARMAELMDRLRVRPAGRHA